MNPDEVTTKQAPKKPCTAVEISYCSKAYRYVYIKAKSRIQVFALLIEDLAHLTLLQVSPALVDDFLNAC